MAEGGESEVKVKADPGNETGPNADNSEKIGLPESVEQLLDYEDRNIGVPRTRMEVQAMPTRFYLDYTVVPILLDGMSAVDRTRWVECYIPGLEVSVLVY